MSSFLLLHLKFAATKGKGGADARHERSLSHWFWWFSSFPPLLPPFQRPRRAVDGEKAPSAPTVPKRPKGVEIAREGWKKRRHFWSLMVSSLRFLDLKSGFLDSHPLPHQQLNYPESSVLMMFVVISRRDSHISKETAPWSMLSSDKFMYIVEVDGFLYMEWNTSFSSAANEEKDGDGDCCFVVLWCLSFLSHQSLSPCGHFAPFLSVRRVATSPLSPRTLNCTRLLFWANKQDAEGLKLRIFIVTLPNNVWGRRLPKRSI